MNMLVKFSPELGAWISHNLDRGCGVHDIIQAMLAQEFDPAVAAGLVNAVVQARGKGLPPPEGEIEITLEEPGFRYEKPRLPAGPVIRIADRDVTVVLRVARPALAVLQSVLSPQECAELIALARWRLRPSTRVDPLTGREVGVPRHGVDSMFLRRAETPFVARIERRIAELMNAPLSNSEGLQVSRHGLGAGSDPRFDFLTPGTEADDASLARSGQRVSSLAIFLNDVEHGGETLFPEIGLSVTPRAGHAVHFEYANSRGDVDLLSAHATATVEAGEKWVLATWVRDRPFVPA